MANLRILYRNLADSATITSTSTAAGYPTSNLQVDTKGSVWRSTSTSATTITVTWSTDQAINCVFLPFTNFTTGSTIRVVLKNSVGTSLYDSGTVSAVPYSLTTWTSTTNSNMYSYGLGTSVRVYTSNQTTVRSMEITVVDGSNPQGYMEISRILCGSYWGLTYNLEYGLEVGYTDRSSSTRSQNGNLIVDNGTISKTIAFSLSYMSTGDRNLLIQLFRQHGTKRPLMVSLFPSDSDKEKEALYEIYGVLQDSGTISHPVYSQFTSSIKLEEI